MAEGLLRPRVHAVTPWLRSLVCYPWFAHVWFRKINLTKGPFKGKGKGWKLARTKRKG